MTDAKDIAPAEKPSLNALKVRPGVGIMLDSVQDVHNFSVFAAATGLVPSSFRNKNGEWNKQAITLALIKGLELGMKPTQALQSIYVVNGIPTIYGDALPGLILASGMLEVFEEWFEGEYPKDTFTAVCRTRRKGMKTDRIDRYSIADAKQAGLWHKNDVWTKHDKRMLQMRPRSYNLRAIGADVLKGVAVYEEVIDVQPEVVPEAAFRSRQEEFAAGLGVDVEWSQGDPDEPQEAASEPQPDAAQETRKPGKRKAPPPPEGIDPEEVKRLEMAEAGLPFEDNE